MMFPNFKMPFGFMNGGAQQNNQQNTIPFPFPFQMPFMNQQPQENAQQNPFPFPFPFQMPFMNQQQDGGWQKTMFPNFNLQNLDLSKLLSMEASPKTMEMLQKVMDFIFDLYNKQCEAQSPAAAPEAPVEQPEQG